MSGFEHVHSSQFGQVSKQVETGLYVVKRLSTYLRKVTAAQDAFAKEVGKVTHHEESKMKVIREDAMFRHVAAAVEVQDLLDKMADRHQKMAESTIKGVIEPLEAFYKKGEERRKKILAAEAKLAAVIKDMRSQVSKERQSCVKMYEECVDVRKEMEDEERKEVSNPKTLEKLQKKLMERREKAKKQFKKFEDMRDKGLETLNDFYTKSMPDILSQMTELELDRLRTLKQYFEEFSKLQQDCTAPIPATQTLIDMINNVNAETELKTLVNNMIMSYGDVSAREPLEISVPCTSDLILTDQWYRADGASVAPSASGPSMAATSRESPASTASAVKAKPPPPSASKKQHPADVLLWVRASFDYVDGQAGDVCFHSGDYIGVTETGLDPSEHPVIDAENPTWWSGFVNGTSDIGRFPNNYTEIVTDPATINELGGTAVPMAAAPQPPAAESKSAPASSALYAKALYDYEYEPTGDPATDNLGYLNFRAGDLIEVKSQAEGEWWFGSMSDQVGYFPANLVELQ